jgi:uncharacterized RDD family membrane protein YckC
LDPKDLEYVGFWPRVGAAMIDTLLLLAICMPLITWVYGPSYWLTQSFIAGPADFLINWVFPAIAVVTFWVYRQATPGKIAVGARIVDADTGAPPTLRQLVVRYLGYYVASIPLFVGIVWVAFDRASRAGTTSSRTRWSYEPSGEDRPRCDSATERASLKRDVAPWAVDRSCASRLDAARREAPGVASRSPDPSPRTPRSPGSSPPHVGGGSP